MITRDKTPNPVNISEEIKPLSDPSQIRNYETINYWQRIISDSSSWTTLCILKSKSFYNKLALVIIKAFFINF